MSMLKPPTPTKSAFLVPPDCGAPVRPRFNSLRTSDRLRESSSFFTPPFKMGGNIRKGRRSIFKEVGLDDDLEYPTPSSAPSLLSNQQNTTQHSEREFRDTTGLLQSSKSNKRDYDQDDDDQDQDTSGNESSGSKRRRSRQLSLTSPKAWYAKLSNTRGRPKIKSTSGAPPGVSAVQRFTMIALLIAVVIPAFSWRNGGSLTDISGASAGVITKRDTSPTDVCVRWALQAAQLNGTLYLYGGRARSKADQEENTWNNYFLTLDLTKDWDVDSPALKGLERPDGPPEISMGYLWHDYNNLYLYGGQFSDSPYVDPGPESIWRYSINDETWTELKDPKTSSGNESEAGGQPVHRAAEGAGLSVPELGLSWYFGGHVDWATTPGWSRDIDRVYLKSLLEFTHPGYVNTGVEKLSDGTGAPESGAFRNITKAGIQNGNFTERADGALVFVPGWGDMGVLIGLAGGTNETFTEDLKTLDVYDIAHSEWFHQETSGDTPSVRVNPCTVIASAPDASSFQIYMFGGQDLPFGSQTQYDDMYILTIPSFTWIKVDQKGTNMPAARAGHSCAMYDGQMVVVGGVGQDIECDPGMYVFDATSLEWQDKFRAAGHNSDHHPDNFVLAGSYGYQVPEAVRRVVGGDSDGRATATTPAAGPATDGPFLTGKPPVFTITQGATATVQVGETGTSTASPEDDDKGEVNGGLVAAGVVAGIFGALALYLGFCAWLYRRQVRAYKHHLAVTNRYSGASNTAFIPSAANRAASRESLFGWVGSNRDRGWTTEPKWRLEDEDDTTPSAEASSGSGGAPRRSEETRPGTSNSGGSTEGLLEGQEPSFFSVVMGPRRALRVVNGAE
ncbi:ring finger b [Fusarium albosuccineum]|uniref:Ring finger b n=1 Tax=Fusarium albosuccineum TaxID=1237068 RepID=A0A8H4L5S8_9HYPO|nr:ring finger b [Fusarium albosuccineum]